MEWPAGTRAEFEVETNTHNEEGSVARFVTWIPWDSGFRETGLQVGDLVVGHAGVRYTPELADGDERVGEAQFSYWFDAQNFKPGDPFSLLVLRDDQEIMIDGRLGGSLNYRSDDGKRLLSHMGPIEYEKDGFDYAWGAWYTQFVDLARTILAGWDYFSSTNTRNLAESLAPFGERVSFLEQHYPGPFARATRTDFEAMQKMVAGERRELSAADVAYRTLGPVRAQAIAEQADRAFARFLEDVEASLLTDAPSAPNPFEADTRDLAAKTVRLPEITDRNILFETRRSWFWSGSGGGGYLIDRQAEALWPFFTAIDEYTRRVDPFFREYNVTFVGVIQPEAALVVDAHRNITVSGLRVQPLAALISNATNQDLRLFVDLRPERAGEAFAGDAAMDAGIRRLALKDDDDPATVLITAFEALKAGDMETWLSCYADWKVRSYYDGPVSYLYVDRTWDVVSRREADSIWDAARRRLMDDVYGVEVARVAASRKVFDASLQMGASAMGSGPQVVEEVRAVVSHICMMDGEYRTFAGSLLHRRWELQRMDNGPWRITSPHGI